MNVDRYGYCVNCGKNLQKEVVVNDEGGLRKIKMFTSEHDETEYLLSDGTTMRVCMCKTCKANLDKIDKNEVMATVKRGWEKELTLLDSWDKKKKEEYTKKYNKLEMVSNSKGKDSKELELELKRFKGLKNKENKNGINK
jgi:hypothetical protein